MTPVSSPSAKPGQELSFTKIWNDLDEPDWGRGDLEFDFELVRFEIPM